MTEHPVAAVLASVVASVGGFLLAAANDVPTWVGIPTGIAGLTIPLGLWLTGRVMLTRDHDATLAQERRRADEQFEAAELRIVDLRHRNERLEADRDAWREAHAAEVEARVAAERAAATLLDQSKLTALLMDRLLGAFGKPGTQ